MVNFELGSLQGGIMSRQRALEDGRDSLGQSSIIVSQLVTLSGNHFKRWQKVFQLLDRVLVSTEEGRKNYAVSAVRKGFTRRTG
jgi:hypothetical protein